MISSLCIRGLAALMVFMLFSNNTLAQEKIGRGFSFNGFELGADFFDIQEHFDSECAGNVESGTLICDESVIAQGVQMEASLVFENGILTRISVYFPADKYNFVLRSIKARYGHYGQVKKGELVWTKKPRGDAMSRPDELRLYKRAPVYPAPDGVKYFEVPYSNLLFESKSAVQRTVLGGKFEKMKTTKKLEEIF